MPKMTNTDLTRLLRSDEIRKVIRPQKFVEFTHFILYNTYLQLLYSNHIIIYLKLFNNHFIIVGPRRLDYLSSVILLRTYV